MRRGLMTKLQPDHFLLTQISKGFIQCMTVRQTTIQGLFLTLQIATLPIAARNFKYLRFKLLCA